MKFNIYYNDELQTQWVADTPEAAAMGWARSQNISEAGARVTAREAGVAEFELVIGDNPDTPQIEIGWWRRIFR